MSGAGWSPDNLRQRAGHGQAFIEGDGGSSPSMPKGSQVSWINVALNILLGLAVAAVLGIAIALLVIVVDERKKWRGQSCDPDDVCILGEDATNGIIAGVTSRISTLVSNGNQQLAGLIESAGKGGGGSGGGIENPACSDPSDLWPEAEFPTRDTDSVAATFCSKCKSTSVPVCSGSVCRIEWQHFDSLGPAATQSGTTGILINAVGPFPAGYYRFQVVLSASTACPVRKIEVALWDETNDMQVGDSVLVNGFAPSQLLVDRIIDVGTTLSLRVLNAKSSDRLAGYGRVLRSSQLDTLFQQTLFDANTEVKWIPFRPGPPTLPPPPPAPGSSPLFPDQYPNSTAVYQWFSPVIPADVYPSPLPTLGPLQLLPDNDGYSKFQSVPTSLDTYFLRDTFNAPSTDPSLTLFLTALEDRGLDRLGRRNHRKTEYMSALTSERSLLYVPKIQAFVNRVYSSVVTNDLPLLSAFKDELIEFFLDVHWGEDPERPDFVREYFRRFIDVVGFGDPTLPGRNEAFMFGADNAQAVRNYARAQTIKVIAQNDQTSIVYHWNLAGLSVEAQLTEAVHNIVAFSQFNHHLFLVVRDKLTGTPFTLPPPVPPVFQYNFLAKYAAAADDQEKLNIIRETYRILLPNGNDFSRVREASPSGNVVSARHLRLPIELGSDIALAGGDQNVGTQNFLNFALDLSRYAPYNTNFTDNNCPQLISAQSDHFYPEDQFGVSPVDGETLIDLCNTKMFPVYPLPAYDPFGLGYRRCAGEAFNMVVTKIIFDRFAVTDFEQRAIPPDTPLVTLAPFVAKPDDIYFRKSLVTVP